MLLKLAAAAAVAFSCGGAAAIGNQALARSAQRPPVTGMAACFNPSLADVRQGYLCNIGDTAAPSGPTFMVWGDSHAYRLATGLDGLAKSQHRKGAILTIGGCPPLQGVAAPIYYARDCDLNVDAGLAFLARHPSIRTVILSADWAYYVDGQRVGRPPSLYHALLVGVGLRAPYSAERSERMFARCLASTVERVRAMGRAVVVVGPVPELEAPEPAPRAQSWGSFLAREKAVLPALDALSRESGVTVVYPSQALCDPRACTAERAGKPLYEDDNHLSVAGVGEVIPVLRQGLRRTPWAA